MRTARQRVSCVLWRFGTLGVVLGPDARTFPLTLGKPRPYSYEDLPSGACGHRVAWLYHQPEARQAHEHGCESSRA